MNKLPYIRSFGRKKSRALSKEAFEIFNSPVEYQLDPENIPAIDVLEIGFGDGEHMIFQAQNNPHLVFLGCEPFINSFTNCLKEIKKQQLTNILLWNDDARIIIEKLPDHSLKYVYILFPDPWPKRRHHNRRVIDQWLVDILAQKLKNEGIIRIATDHPGYHQWISELFAKNIRNYKILTTAKPKDWVITKYQQKAAKLFGNPDVFYADYTNLFTNNQQFE